MINNHENVLYIIMLLFPTICLAQNVSVKTNVVYWATTTLNLGAEVAISPKMTLDLTGTYNPFQFRDNKKIKHWSVQPEWHFWTCRTFFRHPRPLRIIQQREAALRKLPLFSYIKQNSYPLLREVTYEIYYTTTEWSETKTTK